MKKAFLTFCCSVLLLPGCATGPTQAEIDQTVQQTLNPTKVTVSTGIDYSGEMERLYSYKGTISLAPADWEPGSTNFIKSQELDSFPLMRQKIYGGEGTVWAGLNAEVEAGQEYKVVLVIQQKYSRNYDTLVFPVKAISSSMANDNYFTIVNSKLLAQNESRIPTQLNPGEIEKIRHQVTQRLTPKEPSTGTTFTSSTHNQTYSECLDADVRQTEEIYDDMYGYGGNYHDRQEAADYWRDRARKSCAEQTLK